MAKKDIPAILYGTRKQPGSTISQTLVLVTSPVPEAQLSFVEQGQANPCIYLEWLEEQTEQSRGSHPSNPPVTFQLFSFQDSQPNLLGIQPA